MRVTGGSARGRLIAMPKSGIVRPTSDKMRQQIFNLLQHSAWARSVEFELEGAYVLDGFCGSGALGIEALSRGATDCVFIDHDRRVLDHVKGTLTTLGFTDQAMCILKTCQAIGPRPEGVQARTLVMLDPPYKKNLVAPALMALHVQRWIAPGAIILGETERGADVSVQAPFVLLHNKTEGDSCLTAWHYSIE